MYRATDRTSTGRSRQPFESDDGVRREWEPTQQTASSRASKEAPNERSYPLGRACSLLQRRPQANAAPRRGRNRRAFQHDHLREGPRRTSSNRPSVTATHGGSRHVFASVDDRRLCGRQQTKWRRDSFGLEPLRTPRRKPNAVPTNKFAGYFHERQTHYASKVCKL